jgi:hypothetical protein
MTRLRKTGISVAVIAACLALSAGFTAIAQETVEEDWRATRPETTGVMLDLDPTNNVFVVGETNRLGRHQEVRSRRDPALGAGRAAPSRFDPSSGVLDLDRSHG